MRALLLAAALAPTPNPTGALDNGLGRDRPALGWSSWNHFSCGIHDTLFRQTADALVASGLRDAGYRYVNIDDCWQQMKRDPTTHALVPDKTKFPHGMKSLADYIHGKGLLLGIYTSRGALTCQGRPGSDGHEELDAQTFASWGVDYLKVDSCKTTPDKSMTLDDPDVAWSQYSKMRDALNKTGRPIWYSLTGRVQYNDSAWHGPMHCIKPPRPAGYPNAFGAFTPRPWVREGKDVTALANSYLVEYCNNAPFFGETNGRGGFLSQLDSQQLLTYDNLTVPGAYNDNDMLENCNVDRHDPSLSLTDAESRAQLATFAIQSSPLILGNDVRSMTAGCLEMLRNTEILALATAERAPLVYQWPTAEWPNAKTLPGQPGAPGAAAVDIQHQVWAKRMPDGSVGAVAFNRGSAPAAINVTWGMLGLASGARAAVRDLWARTDNGTHRGAFRCEVGRHSVCALRVTAL